MGVGEAPALPPLLDQAGRAGPAGLESWPGPSRCRLGLWGRLLAVGGGIVSHAFHRQFLKRGNTSLLEM